MLFTGRVDAQPAGALSDTLDIFFQGNSVFHGEAREVVPFEAIIESSLLPIPGSLPTSTIAMTEPDDPTRISDLLTLESFTFVNTYRFKITMVSDVEAPLASISGIVATLPETGGPQDITDLFTGGPALRSIGYQIMARSDVDQPVIPEPASIALVGLGLAGASKVIRRRRQVA